MPGCIQGERSLELLCQVPFTVKGQLGIFVPADAFRVPVGNWQLSLVPFDRSSYRWIAAALLQQGQRVHKFGRRSFLAQVGSQKLTQVRLQKFRRRRLPW